MRKLILVLWVVAGTGCGGGGGGGGGSGGGSKAPSPGGVTGTKGDPPPAAGKTPGAVDLSGKSTFLSGQAQVAVPTTSRPALHKPITDPVFGTTITRITDPSMAPGTADKPVLGLRHEYTRYPVASADNSKMATLTLGGTDGGQMEVRDLATGALLHAIPTDSFDPEVSWHPEDSNLLFYRYKNEVRRLHADSGNSDTIMAFPEYSSIRTREEGRPSDDWRYFAFLGYPTGGGSPHVVVADLNNKSVIARWTDPPSTPDWVGMSPSGSYAVLQFVNGLGTQLYRRDLSPVRQLIAGTPHSDFAYDADGDEVLVYDVVDDAEVAKFSDRAGFATVRFRDGAKKFLLESHYWWAIHISGLASREHPGWALVSTYTTPSSAQHPLGREVFWLPLDGSGDVRRIAHHHSDVTIQGDKKDYWAEPHGSPSWDGSRVFFSSTWGDAYKRYDLYMVTGNWFD
jgi:hypothetical protein